MAHIKVLYLYITDDFCWKKILDIDLQSWIYVFAGHPVVGLMKRNNFLFSFYIDQFDKNSFTADKRGTSNLGTTNMKTELHFKSFSLHFIYYKDQNGWKL